MGKVASPSIIFKPAHPNNYAVGRRGGRNGQYTNHHVVGSAESAVAVFQNPNRQASSTFIVSAIPGVVYQMVSIDNTSYADGNAASNARAITTEHHGDWRFGYRNEVVIENAAQLVAWLRDNNLINHQVRHRDVSLIGTQCCADLPIDEIWNRATNIINAAYAGGATTPPPATNADLTWTKYPSIKDMVFKNQPTKLWNFNQTAWSGFGDGVKDFNRGDRVNIYGEVRNNTIKATYLLTEYSFVNKITNGFNANDLEPYVAPAPQKPEWELNRKDITPVKLMVLTAQTPIVGLVDLSIIKQLGQGTWVDFVQSTTVQGKEYLISSYSAQNGMANGILRADVGVPVTPPVNEKPAWLDKWQDIADVPMYARADTDLVNLVDGSTIKVIKRGEKIDVSSTTEWYGHKYAITVYSTDRKEGRGIRIDDLDLKPIEDDKPVDPSPEQPPIETIDKNVVIVFLSMIGKLISDFIESLKGKK